MSNPNDGGPFHPTIREYQHGGGTGREHIEGASLRAYFAGQALKGLLANPFYAQILKETFDNPQAEGQWYVNQSVKAADSLILELAKETP